MHLKIIAKFIELILGKRNTDGEPRADMYLTNKVLSVGLVLIAFGIALAVSFYITMVPWKIFAAVLAAVLGIGAIMCWRNQTIKIISDEKFVYTTFLGNRHEYYFSDITAIRRNRDSTTLFLGKNKVHIESNAVLSDRLVNLIKSALANN